MLRLYAFYAARGTPLQTLAASTPAEIGFLHGARAIYYEELAAVIEAAADRLAWRMMGGEENGQ